MSSKSSKFWKYQLLNNENFLEGQIQIFKKYSQHTYLPTGLEWRTLDIFDDTILDMVYHFLKTNYVEDLNHMYQLEYSKEFIRLMLTPPNYNFSLHLGLIYNYNNKQFLIGFISGTNMTVCMNKSNHKMAEINFLCIDKTLRNKNLAPLLIQEITRRIALTNTQIAFYTISNNENKNKGNFLTECNYYNYYINIKKLQECRFIGNTNFDLNQQYNFDYYYRNTRQMIYADSTRIYIFLNKYLSKFKIHRIFSYEEICHYFSPKNNIVFTNIIEDDDKNITGMYSIVGIKSNLLFENKHQHINMCYLYYYAYNDEKITIENLMIDIIRFAKKKNFDCLNVLNIFDSSQEILTKLNFYKNDTNLNYYLYNYNINSRSNILPKDVGVSLM